MINVGGRHPFFYVSQCNSDVLRPSGVEVDREGKVYVGEFGGSAVYVLDPK